jgi:serine/threonine protein kinase
MPLTAGQVLIQRYRIVSLLGQGGFGAVYRVFDNNLKTACALKENLETSGASQSQFEHEATILANLHHPNLPRVTDHFFIPGQGQYLVMDYIEGQDLETLKSQAGGALPAAQVLNWMTQICDALAYMHAQPNPIIHRDIKPSNIIVQPDGRAMLVDFGIAKIFQSGSHTTVGARGVTPGFAPPEQYGHGRTDSHTDIYALGATMYAVLSGVAPPESLDLLRGAARLAPLRTLNPKVPFHIVAAVERAMQLDPACRFPSAGDFKIALLTPGKVTKIPTRPTGGGRGFPWSWAVLGSGLTLAMLVVLVIGGVLIYQVARKGTNGAIASGSHPSNTPAAASQAATYTPRQEVDPTLTSPRTTEPTLNIQTIATPTLFPTYPPTSPPSATSVPFPTLAPTATWLPTLVPSPTSPAWSGPVWLAYVDGPVGNSDIYISDASGHNSFCIACNPCDESDPAFSPDGQYVVYQADCGGNYDLYRASADGTSFAQLTSATGYDEREPHYSPDGRTIIYQRAVSGENRNLAGEMWIMNADGSNAHSLGFVGRQPVYSPDGNSIAYMLDTGGHWQIFVYDLETFTTRQLTDCTSNCRWPAWSPDGNQIVYNTTVSTSSMDPNGIQIIDLTTNSTTILIQNELCGRPDWSESGWIVFNSLNGIEMIQPNGTNRSVLVNLTDAWGPAWSR